MGGWNAGYRLVFIDWYMGAIDWSKDTEDTWYDPKGYDSYVQGEFQSFRKQAWKDVLGEHLEKDAQFEILDLGTGPGFFACILSEMGHHVTGIDGSPGMLQAAEKNAKMLGVNPKFIHMNYNELTFTENSFDVIVCRNVTWTMGNPEKNYEDLMKLLKPGGIFLIYDSNWYHHYLDPEMDKKVLQIEEEHERIYGLHRDIAGHIDADTLEFIATHPMVLHDRPVWDKEILEKLDAEVTWKQDLAEVVYTDWEKHLYQLHPLFEICARKKA